MSYATPDNGWLLCDGSAVSRTTYAALFAKIGTTYGIGNGIDTFNLPNLTGKFPLGMSSSLSLGATGGEAAHVLTVDELPSHTHICKTTSGTSSDGVNKIQASAATNLKTVQTAATTSTGGGQAHNNMPPYLVINWEIKY